MIFWFVFFMLLTGVLFHCALCYLFIVGYFLVRSFSRMNGKIVLLHRTGKSCSCYELGLGVRSWWWRVRVARLQERQVDHSSLLHFQSCSIIKFYHGIWIEWPGCFHVQAEFVRRDVQGLMSNIVMSYCLYTAFSNLNNCFLSFPGVPSVFMTFRTSWCYGVFN